MFGPEMGEMLYLQEYSAALKGPFAPWLLLCRQYKQTGKQNRHMPIKLSQEVVAVL